MTGMVTTAWKENRMHSTPSLLRLPAPTVLLPCQCDQPGGKKMNGRAGRGHRDKMFIIRRPYDHQIHHHTRRINNR